MNKVFDAKELFKRRRMAANLRRKHPTFALRLAQWLKMRERGIQEDPAKPWKPDGERT